MKLILAGGSGFIGSFLAEKFSQLGYEIIMISRKSAASPPAVAWSDAKGIKDALDGADLLINLAGKSVDCRYNQKNKDEILRSRVETTRALGEAVSQCQHPPKLWINSSTATIYRHAEDRPMTESQGEIGTGFSVDVAKAWEQAFFGFNLPRTRQVALRMAIVLGKSGGAIHPYLNLARYGLGGIQGNGRQMFSWIHVDDIYGIIRYLIDHPEMEGVYNCSAPHPVNNRELMKILREASGTKIGLPSPKWMLEIGAAILGTETELLLKSRWVLPERLEAAGYQFKFAKLEDAIAEITGKKRA